MWNGSSEPGTQTMCRNEGRVLSYIADAFWKHWQKLGKMKTRSGLFFFFLNSKFKETE